MRKIIAQNELSPIEKEFENGLRPSEIADFTGQEQLVENLRVFIQAARQRAEPLDHVLFHGPPGLGKTTLSRIVATELGVQIKETSGPVLEKPADLAGILTSLQTHNILFIDEIHRLPTIVEEYLYAAMEDYKVDIVLGKEASARNISLQLHPFTLIGATTRSGLLSAPLLSRFGIKCRLSYYSVSTLEQIVKRSAKLLNESITDEAAVEIARRSRGTPRIVNALLKRVRDFAQIFNNSKIDATITQRALHAMNVDEFGLDEMDNRILRTIIEKFSGGPVGLSTIATAISESTDTLEEVYEPFLIQEGFLMRTPRGRVALPKAYKHLGFPPDAHAENVWAGTLFQQMPSFDQP